MMKQAQRLYTAAEVRRLDDCAIRGHGIPGIELMERAGRGVFEVARAVFPAARNWLVCCGGGNNGGDGYIAARLAREAGLSVRLCALKEPAALSGDAAAAAQRWLDAGGAVETWPTEFDECDLVLDALLGTGLDREPEGAYGEAIDAVNASSLPVVAVDIPSGLNADTGVALGRAVRADRTVTFIGSKRGLFTADGPDYAGIVEFNDLETPDSVRDSESNSGILLRENIIHEYLPPRRRNSHKGSYGWLLGVGGDAGMSGAVRLCGEAALRAGAGKVTLATRSGHAALVNVACPELMVRGAESGTDLEDLLQAVDAVAAGIGLGRSGWSEDLLQACLESSAPLLLDADGLNLLADRFARQKECEAPRGGWILTPHPAEAGRLLGRSARSVQQDRVGAAQQAARRYHAVVVLKGCGTVVAGPDGRYAICALGNPGMATAGSGDVLTGVIGAMLAQGLACWEAALVGVTAHALAGDLAAQQGQRGMLASDITHCLRAALNPGRPQSGAAQ